MKLKKVKLSAWFLGLVLTAHAQQAVVTSGGDASGSGGSAAFSVGQVVYTTNTAAAGSVAQGVQQPYEVSIVSGVEDQQISLQLQVYPNPTADYLALSIGELEMANLNFELFDMNGKLLEHKKVESTTEMIHMGHLPSATYFLKVMNQKKDLKTFKIIKF
jgi:hypothetical protein